MNIFEVIRRTEPIHTRFLVAALQESAANHHSLFRAVWRLVAPPEWEVPERPQITAEEDLNRERIDFTIRDNERRRIVGIEVKTVESSRDEGQLKRYLKGLRDKYKRTDIAIAYLTPFNKERATRPPGNSDAVRTLPTVEEFEKFTATFPNARHVSWLDVADIPWISNTLWEQHREYVRDHISAPTLLQKAQDVERNRTLDHFFGEVPTQRFTQALVRLGIDVGELDENITIDLKGFGDKLPSFAQGLVEALGILVHMGEGVTQDLRSAKPEAFSKRDVFRKSDFRAVHEALFGLAERNNNVWVQGTQDYAVRVAHDDHSSGVSLITSIGASKLHIRGRR